MKQTEQICLRLSRKQYDFIQQSAEILGETPSKYVRCLIDSARYQTAAQQSFFQGLENNEGNSQ